MKQTLDISDRFLKIRLLGAPAWRGHVNCSWPWLLPRFTYINVTVLLWIRPLCVFSCQAHISFLILDITEPLGWFIPLLVVKRKFIYDA